MAFYEVIITGDQASDRPRERAVMDGGMTVLVRAMKLFDALIASGRLTPDAIQNGNGRKEVSTYDTVKLSGTLLVEVLKKLGDGDFRHPKYASLDEFLASVDPAGEYSVYLSEV